MSTTPEGGTAAILTVEEVNIEANCCVSRWTTQDLDVLARVIAIIAMGQAAHAAQIITELLPAEPTINEECLRADAKAALSIKGDTDDERKVSRYHRDGLVFEAISWAVAQMATGGKALLRDPHIKSTTQGLDGLMIELDATGTSLRRATIFEDKCSEAPRKMFRNEIMPAFLNYHKQLRSADLLAAAAALLEKAGLKGTNAIQAAARVLNKDFRIYRGCLAITPNRDTMLGLKRLFKGYEDLDGIDATQRVGGVLVTGDDLREWFDGLAERAISYIESLGNGEV